MTQPPFLVLSLPRSRSFWLSRYLSYGGWTCGHEELRHVRSLDDVRSWLSLPCTGTCETAAAPWWRTLRDLAPDARVVVVRRPVAEVEASLLRLGIGFEQPMVGQALRKLDAKLDQVAARWPGAMAVPYADLVQEEACERIFCYCLGLPHDPAWWRAMAALNLQCDLAAMIQYMQAHRPQLDKVAATVKHGTLASLQSKLAFDTGGMVIAEESFRTAWRDAQHLVSSHLAEVGESPDAAQGKNVALLERLDDLGALQVVTARSNGRMFGYLLTVIAPSLESADRKTAVHATFFADASAPGLGMKLQRAALAAVRAKGTDELLLRAGVRGSGPRLGTLYRRLGAQYDGDCWKIDMQRAGG